MTTLTTPMRERRAPATRATGLAGRQRRADDRRRVLVSETLATVRGSRLNRPMDRPLERAGAVLERMRTR